MSRLIKALFGLYAIHQGVKQLGGALQRPVPPQLPQQPSMGVGRQLPPGQEQERVVVNRRQPPPRGAPTARVVTVANIDERVGHIVDFIRKGSDDPLIRQNAVKAVSARCGNRWCTPQGNDRAEVNALFKNLSQNLSEHSKVVKSLFAGLRKQYRYVRDPVDKDLFASAARVLEAGGGDCDCGVVLLGASLRSIGYPVAVVIIQTKGAQDFNHVFLEVGLPPEEPQRFVPLDISVPGRPPGWSAPANMIVKKKRYPV